MLSTLMVFDFTGFFVRGFCGRESEGQNHGDIDKNLCPLYFIAIDFKYKNRKIFILLTARYHFSLLNHSLFFKRLAQRPTAIKVSPIIG